MKIAQARKLLTEDIGQMTLEQLQKHQVKPVSYTHLDVYKRQVKAYLEERVIPKLKEMGLTGHVFVKNGRFSNKFNANGTCNLYGLHELYRAISLINYEAICCGAEGADEIVVRKFIESSVGMTPCIYNGLPCLLYTSTGGC